MPPAGLASLHVEVSSTYPAAWTSVATERGAFDLVRPLLVKLAEDGGLWTAWCPELRVLGHGETPREAIRSFGEEFLATWDGLADVEDEMLTLDAQQLRQKLLDLVESAC